MLGPDAPSVVMIVLDELPTRSLLDEAGGIDRAAVPELRRARRRVHLVPPPHVRGRLHAGRRALPAHRPGTQHQARDLHRAPRQPLHHARADPRPRGHGVGDPAVPLRQLSADGRRRDRRKPVGARLGDLLGEVRSLWRNRVALGPTAPLALDDFEEDIEPEAATRPPRPPNPPSAPPRRAEASCQTTTSCAPARRRADTFIDAFDASKGPALYFLHLMLPHQPWRRYPDGSIYQDYDPLGATLPKADQEARFTWAPWVATVTEQRHLLQLQYTDQVLGSIVQGLRDAGLYDESVIVVVSDHGASFEVGTLGQGVAAVDARFDRLHPAVREGRGPDRRRGRRHQRDGLRRRAHDRRARGR